MTQTMNSSTRPSFLMIGIGVLAGLAVTALQQQIGPGGAIAAVHETLAAATEVVPVMGSGQPRELRQYSKDVADADIAADDVEALPVMGTGQSRPLTEFSFETYQSQSSAKAE